MKFNPHTMKQSVITGTIAGFLFGLTFLTGMSFLDSIIDLPLNGLILALVYAAIGGLIGLIVSKLVK